MQQTLRSHRAHQVCVCLHRHRHIASVASAQADSSKKQIAIVGGGLGGLTAARVLQKHGFKPIVFERDTSDNSRVQGAALDLHPESGENMSKSLVPQVPLRTARCIRYVCL